MISALQDLDRLARSHWSDGSVSLSTGHTKSIYRALELAILFWVALQVSLGFASVLFIQPDTRNVPTFLLLATAIAFLGGAVGLLRTAPADGRAWHLALLFASIASATSILLQPRPGDMLGSIGSLTVVLLPEALMPYFLWSFVERFPRVSRFGPFGRMIRQIRYLCLAVGLLLVAVHALSGVPAHLRPLFETPTFLIRRSISGYWLTIFILAFPAPFVALLRAREAVPSERRRTLLFVLGLALGILPLFLGVLAEIAIPSFHEFMSRPGARRVGSMVVYGSLLTIPLTASIAVSASFFKIQPVLKHATRLALERSTLLVLSASSLVTLLAFLWFHRHESLAWLVLSPTVIALTGCVALGPLLLWLRPFLVAWFVGPSRRVSPGRALGDFARGVHAVRDLHELEQLTALQSRDLFEAPNAKLLLRTATTPDFLPISDGCRPLASNSLIATLVRNQEGPLAFDVFEPSPLTLWLPEDERQWLADSAVGVVIPLLDALGATEGILVLERRSNHEPYDREEQRVMQALASTALLGITRLRATSRLDPSSLVDDVEGAAGECRDCSAVVDAAVWDCPCGGAVEPAVVPRLLRGKFRVERLLGAGGMGRVYLALDQDLQRQVALKTLPRLRTRSLVRLRREAQSMASFIHPNLATIFGLETWRGVPILVVEYLSGGTLGASTTERLSPIAVVELGLKLVAGLEAMHCKGMLHRDVKPSNIGFDSVGEPKLLDFGLAGLVDHAGILPPTERPAESGSHLAKILTATHQVVGTLPYLSPEVLGGKRFSEAEDLWSLHLVLWEALAGHHPLAHESSGTITRQLRSGKIPSIASVRPDCPADLVQLLNDGLSAPHLRPKSAAEMRQRLLAVLR